MDTAYLQARIDSLKARIEAYEAAHLALATGGVESYSLDTGQTIQKVTKMDLQKLQDTIDAMLKQLSVLCNRLNGGGTVTAIPSW